MGKLMQKFMEFMQGRYGYDQLNSCLFVLFLLLYFINIFVFNLTVSLILSILQYAILGYSIFRTLSRKIEKRSAENRAILPLYNAVTGWFKLSFRKFRERKDFRYIKCPTCKAQLRVKNIKGKHTVRCPKCKLEFQKKI